MVFGRFPATVAVQQRPRASLPCSPQAPACVVPPLSYRQALVLTHELADGGHFNDYLVRKLSPLRPLLSLGRAARAWPPGKVKHAVMHWWRDSAPSIALRQVSLPPLAGCSKRRVC